MNKTRGFSMIELLMIIVIVGVIASTAGAILRVGFQSYFTSKPIMSNVAQANIAMFNIMGEISNANSMTALGTTSLTFINRSGQSIVINLNGTTLQRSVNGGTAQPECTNVTSLTFAYYTSALAVTASPTNVQYVTLNINLTDTSVGTAKYSLMNGKIIRTQL